MNENSGRVYIKDLLEPIMTLVGDMGEVKGSLKGVDAKLERVDNDLKQHLEECMKNGQRQKDKKGKYEERRQGKLRRWVPVIALVISIITLLGGWTFIKYQADNINDMIQDYDKFKQSQSK